MKTGYYFVLCDACFYEDAIVTCTPYVLLAYYLGDGEWNTELLHGERYKVKPVEFPATDDFE